MEVIVNSHTSKLSLELTSSTILACSFNRASSPSFIYIGGDYFVTEHPYKWTVLERQFHRCMH